MKPIFRSAMLGFNKQDVADFISKQNHQNELRVDELKSQLESAKAQFEKEREDFVLDKEELESLRAQAKLQKEKFALAVEMTKKIQNKVGDISETGNEWKEALDGLQTNVDIMAQKLADAEKFRDKAERFDRLASVLGEIVSGTKIAAEATDENPSVYQSEVKVDASSILEKQNEIIMQLGEFCKELIVLLCEADATE